MANIIDVIKGSAGTGKTYSIKKYMELNRLPNNEKTYVACSFTNKAVAVLTKNGIEAKTIHKLFYHPIKTGTKIVKELILDPKTHRPIRDKRGNIKFNLIEKDELDYKFDQNYVLKVMDKKHLSEVIIVIDEAGMVPSGLWRNLISSDLSLIIVGDHNQLEPVEIEFQDQERILSSGKAREIDIQYAKDYIERHKPYLNWFAKQSPTIQLTKIYRQSEGSNIIKVAKRLLESSSIEYGKVSDVTTTDWDRNNYSIFDEKVLAKIAKADVVIAFRNADVKYLNSIIRAEVHKEKFLSLSKKRMGLPRTLDKIYINSNLEYFRDGVLTTLAKGTTLVIEKETYLDKRAGISYCNAYEDSTDIHHTGVPLNVANILKSVGILNVTPSKDDTKASFDFGFALTCHKCQGGEWNNVMVIDTDSYYCSKNWRYTAITRASKKLYYVTYKKLQDIVNNLDSK